VSELNKYIFFIIFAFIGFITEMIWGLNVYKLYSDLGAIIVISVISILFLKATEDTSNSIDNITNILTYLAYQLIPMAIGDAAGTFVGNIIKSFTDDLND